MKNQTFRTLTLVLSLASLAVAILSYRAVAAQRGSSNDTTGLPPLSDDAPSNWA